MKAMILAAGAGTRLRPLTDTIPKPLLPVSGRPAMEWTVLWLKRHGIASIAINLSHRPIPVIAHFEDGSKFDLKIAYSVEEDLLGTAGGVKRIQPFFDSPFVLVYGDILTDFDLQALIQFHKDASREPHVTLSLIRAPNPTECGVVELDGVGRIVKFVEKPKAEEVFSDLTNAGVLIFDPEILNQIPANQFYDFSNDLFPKMLSNETPIFGMLLPETDYLIDIGSHAKYAQVQSDWPTERSKSWVKTENGEGDNS